MREEVSGARDRAAGIGVQLPCWLGLLEVLGIVTLARACFLFVVS